MAKYSTAVEDVTFGMEYECTVPLGSIGDHSIHIGAWRDPSSLGQDFPNFWKGKTDASIRAREGRTDLEAVSPILLGASGLLEAMSVAESLCVHGARVNLSCGFHVHIGFKSIMGMNPLWRDVAEWVRRLILLVGYYENGLLAVTGSQSRIDNHFCRSIKGTWETRVDYLKLNQRGSFLTDLIGAGIASRYDLLNLTNLFSNDKSTVEFRSFPGTLNPIKVAAYVQIALGLAVKAAEETGSAKHWGLRENGTKHHHPFRNWEDEWMMLRAALGWNNNKGAKHYGWLLPWEDWSTRILDEMLKMARKLDTAGVRSRN